MARINGRTEVNINSTFLESALRTVAGGAFSQIFNITGMKAPTFAVIVGAEHASDTLSATNKYTMTALNATTTGGTYANCTTTNFKSETDIASGVWAEVVSAATADTIYTSSYHGINDFVNITVTPAGTIDNGSQIGIICYDAAPLTRPASND